MMDFTSMPPVSGAMLSVAIYAALAVLVSGPMVGERMIARSGWAERCPELVAAAARQEADPPPLPGVDCGSLMGLVAPELRALCNPVDQMVGEVGRQQRELQTRRMHYASAGASSRCDCATGVALETNRTAFAMHAGSLRLITPQGLQALDSGLERALSGPICAARE